MPVLDPERRAASRSALRYRPIATDEKLSAPAPVRARQTRADARGTTAPVLPDHLDAEEEAEHLPRRRRVQTPAARPPTQPAGLGRRVHPLLFVGLGLVLALLLWSGIAQAVNWANDQLNTLKYGYPRTFQVDAVVGHGDSALHPSHFVALNLHGVVTILEFPAGDPARLRTLAATSVPGSNAEYAVVTLRFIDVSHTGKPDMLIAIDSIQSVLINDGKTFRLPTLLEEQTILNGLHESS